MKIIDNRGLPCPEPLLRTRKALENERTIVSVVDNEAARENILRYARQKGLEASWERQGEDYHITVTAPSPLGPEPGITPEEAACLTPEQSGEAVLLLTGDTVGRGSEELGRILMRSFIYTLTRREKPPRALLFVNAAVKLACSGSDVLEDLALLAQRGVPVLSCGTCLDYYRIKDSLAVGEVTNMYDVVDLLLTARTVTV